MVIENKECQKCDLCKTSSARGMVEVCILGCGSKTAKLVLIGEAPGYEEVLQRKPFVGEAGKVLDKCLAEAGIQRDSIYISNVCKCRPLNNVVPKTSQVKACAEYLDKELEEIKPIVIGLLGNTAISRMLNGVGTVTHLRGTPIWSEKYHCWCVPMFHPAYVLRNISQSVPGDLLVKDLRMAKEIATNGMYDPKKIPVTYKACLTKADVEDLFKELDEQSSFVFDFETDSLNALDAKVLSISLSWKEATATVLPFVKDRQDVWSKEDEAWIWQKLAELFSSDKVKIAQNLNYDGLVLKAKHVWISFPTFDTMLAHHLLDENARGEHGLKDLAWRYTDMGGYEKEIEKYFKGENGLLDAPSDVLFRYTCGDADCTFRVVAPFRRQLEEEKLNWLYDNITMKLQRVLIDSMYQGVRIDESLLKHLAKEYGGIIADIETRLRNFPEIHQIEKDLPAVKKGEQPKFNFGSPLQLRKLFFTVLKLPQVRTTEKGNASTDEEVLSVLAVQHEIPKLLLDHRRYSKLYNTYIKGTQKLLRKGRIHTTFLIHGTVTGRIASSQPNLQNVPTEVRKIFIADEGCTLISADYKQAEFRMWANYSQDPQMIADIKAGKDIHSMIASAVLGVKEDEAAKEQRSLAKGVVFGLMYGRGIESLVQELKCSPQVAQQIIQTFFGRYPKARQWLLTTQENARKSGRVRNFFGRIRRLPLIYSSSLGEKAEAERQAVNSPIQGGAADVTAIAMIRVYERLKKENRIAYQILTVHDSIVWNCPTAEVEEVVKLIYEEMTRPIEGMVVPFDVDIKTGKNWGDI